MSGFQNIAQFAGEGKFYFERRISQVWHHRYELLLDGIRKKDVFSLRSRAVFRIIEKNGTIPVSHEEKGKKEKIMQAVSEKVHAPVRAVTAGP